MKSGADEFSVALCTETMRQAFDGIADAFSEHPDETFTGEQVAEVARKLAEGAEASVLEAIEKAQDNAPVGAGSEG